MPSARDSHLISSARRQILDRQFSRKSIQREKRKIIRDRSQSWASLGADQLQQLANRYSPELYPARSTLIQIAFGVHRVFTAIPTLIFSPIASALGALKAHWVTSDALALTNLKQRHLLATLRRLNAGIEELLQMAKIKVKERPVRPALNGLPRGKIAISSDTRADLKAILAYTQAFRASEFETLRGQIARFEEFVAMVNALPQSGRGADPANLKAPAPTSPAGKARSADRRK